MLDVVAAILVHEGKVFTARRAEGQRLAGQWEFPGGKLEQGESPEKALKREMLEEFGMMIRVGRKFDHVTHEDENGRIRLSAFWALWEGGEPQLTVHDAMAWIEPACLQEECFAPADRFFVQRLKRDELTDFNM